MFNEGLPDELPDDIGEDPDGGDPQSDIDLIIGPGTSKRLAKEFKRLNDEYRKWKIAQAMRRITGDRDDPMVENCSR